MEFIGYVALIGIGVILGSIGSGGSILAIPVLVYLFSIDMVMASAYSMFLVGITSLAGALVKQKKQLIDMRAGTAFGIPSIITTFIARRWLVVAIPEVIFEAGSFRLVKDELLLGLLSLLMIGSSVTMILKPNSGREADGEFSTFHLICAGIFVGLLAGLVGAGGGFLILPALVFFARLPFRKATGTTLLIIASNSLLGFCGDLLNQSFNWTFLLTLTGLALLGLYIGDASEKFFSTGSSPQKPIGWITLMIGLGILIAEIVGLLS